MWIYTDPALGEYIPKAPIDEEEKKHNQNLPGMGGVFNHINGNLYHYAGNNPVRYIDPDGREAGDLFDTIDEVAKDFAKTYNDDSIKNNVELASYIRKKNDKYYYDIPVAGDAYSVKLTHMSTETDIVAMIHTHGAYFKPYDKNEMTVSRALEFSNGDLEGFLKDKLVSYVVVPTGEMFCVDAYNPKDGFIISAFKPIYPSDPNCPGRKNTLDAWTCPDNYYIRGVK